MIKFNRLAALALLLATSVGSWAAGEAAAPGPWEKFKAFTHQQKDEAVAEGKKLMAATDKKLAEMSKQAKGATGEVKVAHEKNMKELQAKRKVAQAELGKMQKSASNTWDATKEGFSNAYQDLHQSVEKATAAAKSK